MAVNNSCNNVYCSNNSRADNSHSNNNTNRNRNRNNNYRPSRGLPPRYNAMVYTILPPVLTTPNTQ